MEDDWVNGTICSNLLGIYCLGLVRHLTEMGKNGSKNNGNFEEKARKGKGKKKE